MHSLISAEQAAKLLNVSVPRVYDLARSEILPCVRLGRQLRFSEQALTDWINSGGQSLPGGWKREPDPAQGVAQ